ncbi:hypothetical protein MMC11_001287 [Xylographa trunciseda]|nr:hypothetical protein [Xylographa trunciseda]
MAETSPSPRSSTPATIPQKRPLGIEDEQHVPAVPSPLNPDFASSRARKAAPAREQREKKESLKKREAKGVESVRGGTPDSQALSRKPKKGTEQNSSIPSLLRYKLPPPNPTDFDPPKAPILVPIFQKVHRQFFEASEHVFNRKGFRYTHCIADPAFTFTQYHRGSETEPFAPRFDYEDTSSHIFFDSHARSITTEKGFRMARANVGAREGRWYWECKILSGVKPNGHDGNSITAGDSGGHVRLGFSRREATLDTPVGFDAYSYGLRDVAGQKVHMSRPKDFMPAGEQICEGDVIGLEINLPSLTLHRKVVEGSYNKAVDVSDDVEPQGAEGADIIRDRLPIRYKAHLYFEQFEYQSCKELEELMNPSPVIATTSTSTTAAPNPNHSLVALRTLPFSCIKVYKNGQYVGTPFTDLLAFLPPASKPLHQVGARDGLDDGMLGYFPSVSVFRGGAAEVNFGPEFWYPPPDVIGSGEDVDMLGEPGINNASRSGTSMSLKKLRSLAERYNEQIAEDVMYDIIDEVDLWAQDGGQTEAQKGASDPAPTILGPVDPAAPGLDIAMANSGVKIEPGQPGEIKEIIQEEE